jgi:anthranilate phosphoribosyltransferase
VTTTADGALPPSYDTTWPAVLTTLLRGDDLRSEDTAWVMEQVMSGEATPVQTAGFVMALRAKGEAPAEITGLVTTMMAHAARITVDGPAVDTCGTGGDRAQTVNISTMSAMVVAGAGAQVVKHGNRAASSACGSADLLEELGVVVDLAPALVETSVREARIGFCFAPRFHPALRHTLVARRELGVATVFNFLGPLANPAQPSAQAVGVADARMAGVLADVLAARGASALVFRGEDGLDELTTGGPSRVWVVREGGVWETTITPADVGLPVTDAAALRGGDAAHNAAVVRRFLDGEKGPVRDAVLLNAAAALVALQSDEQALDERLPDALRDGLGRAAAAVDDGSAGAALERWVTTSQRLAAAAGPA